MASYRHVPEIRSYAQADRFLGKKLVRSVATNTKLVRTLTTGISLVIALSGIGKFSIIEYYEDGTVFLNSNGYRFPVIKNRFKKFSPVAFIIQRNGKWLVTAGDYSYYGKRFYDHMNVGAGAENDGGAKRGEADTCKFHGPLTARQVQAAEVVKLFLEGVGV